VFGPLLDARFEQLEAGVRRCTICRRAHGS